VLPTEKAERIATLKKWIQAFNAYPEQILK
jgi:hypothetical protein